LQLLQTENWRQPHLQQLIRRFRAGAESLSLPLMDSGSAIQPILVGDSESALQLSAALRQREILVSAIRPPTVPAGTARLRVTLSAAHSEADVDRLLDALAASIRE
jgi:8-amino-7-oxononanoate synthase